MEKDQFMATRVPGGRKSVMDPRKDDLLALREKGYTLEQLKEFLELNNIWVCKTGIFKFLKKHQPASKEAATIAPPDKAGGKASSDTPVAPLAGFDTSYAQSLINNKRKKQ